MGKLEDNNCQRDRNDDQDDECEHALSHPCDDCPFRNMNKCRYCDNDFMVDEDDPESEICPDCAQEFGVTLPAGQWVMVMDKLAGTGNPDPEELGQIYQEIAKMVVS